MVIDKIRTATKPIHTRLDEGLMPAFQRIDSKERYAAMLKAFYGYFKPVMDAIDQHLDRAYLPDYAERRKPSLILDDLEALGMDTDIIPAAGLPAITDSSTAFGALYVLEGSTLGGVYLSSVLAKNMPADAAKALQFFYGYGKESKERWTAFVDQLNTFAAQTGNEEAIVIAAVDTFTCFQQHLEKALQQ